MFMGTRADLAPHPLSVAVFRWSCAKCQAQTYSIAKPPPDATLVCNVCVSQMTEQAEHDQSTQVMWGMTKELGDGVQAIVEEKGRPVEEVFNRFIEWKLGRPTRTVLYRKPEKKNAKE
ncbi:MAG: hypothetical protein M3361_08190 [Candidatus Tectomicrobia bacterium]|nr:hypothetical protein [Candidatus Tectomicrobia bacterium]